MAYDVDRTLWPLFEKHHRIKYGADGEQKVVERTFISKQTQLPENAIRMSARRWRESKKAENELQDIFDGVVDPPDKIMPIINKIIREPQPTLDPYETGTEEDDAFVSEFIKGIDNKNPTIKGRPYVVYVIGCLHIPYHHRMLHPSAEAFMKFMVDNPPDELILNGDVMDFSTLSWFDKNKPLKIEGKRVKYEYEFCNSFIDECQRYSQKTIYNKGNHEIRVDRFIEENSVFEGFLELEHQLKLSKRKIRINEENDPYYVGEASFLHGYKYGKYHAAQMLEDAGGNVYYHHTHDCWGYVKPTRKTGTIEAHSLGCLSALNPQYRRNQPSRWDNAFGAFYFKDDGSYTRYIPIITNNSFTWTNGKEYKGG